MDDAPWRDFALLLIDVQHDFWTAKRRTAHPHFPENVARLLTLARGEGLEVLHVRAAFDPDPSTWMPRHRLLGSVPCIRGTSGAEPLSCAHELPGEPVFYKQTFTAFSNPLLEAHLRARGKRFLLVAGLVTSVCVLMTATAAERGLLVAVVGDACADSPGRHEATLVGYPFIFEATAVGALPERRTVWLSQVDRLKVRPSVL